MGETREKSSAGRDAVGRQRARRDALKRLGVYGAVSAPILMGVLKADQAVAQSPIPGPFPPGLPGECLDDVPASCFD